MNYFSLPKLLIFSAALFLGYSSFSQAVFIDSSGKTPKYKQAKKPGGRMTDFQGAMDYEFNMIKNPVTGKIPEGSFTKELEQAKAILAVQQKNNTSNAGTPYAFQGPNNLGGRTRSLAYDVRYNGTTNRIILAGGVSGGVYKSIDDGATWVRKSPIGAHFSCTSIAQDTRPGFEDTWYYGVGESSGNSASGSGASYFGNGVYKSTDNGETWARLISSNTSALESFSTGADAIQKVIVDPTDGFVYVACLAKIMRSVDGGTTWVDVLPGVLAFSSQTTDIVVSATGRLYASFGGTNDSGVDGVWASPPGATSGDPGSWTRIAGSGAGGSPAGWNFEAPSGTPGGYGRVVLTIPPSAPTLLYALYWNNVSYTCGAPAPEAELFRWDDVAATWTNLSATLPDEAGCSAGNDPFAVQGGYDLVIAVKPDAAGTLFIGGTNAYRSTDAGLTWTRIGGYAGTGGYALYTGSHPDIHAFVFQPGSPSIMLCGNDGGIQRTTDNLAGTVAWTPINTGYRTYQYYHVTVDPRVGNAKVLGGAQDNGTTRNIGGSGTSFEGIFGGDGVSVGLSDLVGGIQYEYVGFQFGEIFSRDATLGSGFGSYITPAGESGTGLFVTLFKLDVDNSEILYYANDNKLYRTLSGSTVTSATWTDMTGIGTAVGAASDITAIATTRGTYSAATASLFLGTSNGRVFRLNDPAGVAAGTGPVEISLGAGFPAVGSGNISSIAVNPRNDDTLMVTFSNYGVTSVFWTGTANSALPTWTAVEGTLTLPSYRSSAIAVTTAGVEYFVGTSTGLYTSMGLPGAVAWTQEGATEMGNAVVSSLALRASDGKLLVGTHGYGMWETSLPTGAACTITLTSAVGTNAQTVCINTAITNITYATTDATGATFSGLPAGVTGVWAANVVTISGTPTASGVFSYTVTLTGGSCVGVTATGTITVTANNTVTLTSAAGTDAQTVCISTPITTITYATTGATGATFSGLPAGVTGSWAANVVTISGTPTASGVFSYTVTLTGGCGTITATGSITVTANNTVTLTSAAGTNAQTISLGSPITTITYATTGATGATVTGLPAGVTGGWAANVVTISGTPTAAGVFSYTVTLTGGCGTVTATGTITVNPPTLETWELSAAAGSQASSAPTTTATNISAGTLTRGAGVTASAGAGSISSSGWFNSAAATTLATAITNNEYYEFTLPVNAGFTADITAVAFYLRSSSTGPNSATLRSSADGYTTDLGTATAIPNAAASLYTLPVTLTGISGTLTFRLYGWGGASGGGTPSTGGTMRIGTSPTALADDLDIFGTTAAASICSATLTSAAGTNAQTVCISTAITTITYSTIGATGATFSGLPVGVTGSWAANVITISGTPTAAGVFSYTATLSGGPCTVETATGIITVTANNTVTLTSAAGTNAQTVCITTPITTITYATTGATGATFSGLPAGITGSWAANVITISGTPTAAGVFSYTVTLSGGCGTITATGSITVTANNTVTLTSAAGTNAQTVCISTPITTITYATTGATGATFSGLPAGVTGSWAANVASISGTPTASGVFSYTVTLTGGCGTVTATGSITVTANNTVTLTSAAGTNAQTITLGSPIITITYATTGATGATVTGLPAGVTGSWAANVVTISGTPTATGTFSYTVTLTGGCGTVTATGTITVNPPGNTITLTSAPGTDAQTVCISTPITPITYTTTGATGATFSGLPAGVAGVWAASVVTISGTPSASGTFSYTITLSGGSGTGTATGTITVTPNNTVTLASAAGTNAQTVCISTPITTITYATTGATGATFSGLPAGLTSSWAANVATISGTPTASGVFSYTVTLTGGCGTVTATGSITVTANNTVTLTSAAGTNAQTVCISTPITTITYATTGATGATFSGLPAGVTGSWAANVATISGTPTASGVFSYTVTLTGGCGSVTSTGSITVTANNTVTLTSAAGTNAQTITLGSPITTITYATTGATGATVTGLPAGVTGILAANVFTISGTPTATGTFSYTVNLTGGCGTVTATGTITVNSPAPVNDNCSAATPIACGGTASGNTSLATIDGPATDCGGGSVARDVWYSITGTGGTITASLCGGGTTYDSQLDVYTGTCGTLTNIGGCNDDFCGLQSEMTWATTLGTTYLIRVHGFAGSFGAYTLNITCVFPCTIALSSAPGTNAQTVCQNLPITNITYNTTVATGATFSGLPAGVTGSWAANMVTISGTPTVSGVFNYTVTLVGCTSPTTATGTITVTAPPTATIAYSGSPYCSNAGTATVTRTGTAGGTYTAAPAGLTINAATGAVTLATSTAGTYTVSYTIAAAGGCPAVIATASITVTALPVATITYTGSPYCSTDLTAPVTRTGTAGGTYSAAPAGLTINAATGTVTPNTSTPGTYTVTYTIATAGGCPTVTTTTSITITAAPNMIIFYAGTPYCSNAGTANVSRFGTAGGTYSAAPAGLTINAATGAVTLATSTPGTYTVTYSVTLPGCGITNTTTTITITAAPNATIAYTGSPYCSNAGTANVTLTGTPAGGTYSSTAGLSLNAATGAVNLAASTAGTYTVTYTVAASGGCATYTTTANITITTLPAATIAYTGSPYCANAGTATVTRTGTAGGTYTAAAGLSINAATGDVNLGASTAGTYMVTYTLAAGGGCPAVAATTSITITTLPAATISYAGTPFCQPGGIATVTRTGTAGGVYSAAPAGLSINATTGDINVTTSTPGTYTVTYTLAAGSGCPVVTATTAVTINAPSVAPTAANATATALCGPGTVTLSLVGGSLGSGATWRWYSGSCGGTSVGTGATLNVTVNATTTYFVRAEGTCNTTACASVTVTVNAQPTISITTTATTIKPGQNATLTATVTPAGTPVQWYRDGNVVPGATGTTLTVGVANYGTYTARATTAAGCTALSTGITITAERINVVFVYPNPSRGQFQVRVYNQPGKQLSVLVYNSQGQRVYYQRMITSAPYTRMDVDMRNAAAGTYIVQVLDSDGEIIGSKPIIIQR